MKTDENGNQSLSLRRAKKVYENEYLPQLDLNQVHSVIMTKGEKYVIFVDRKDMFILNLENAKETEDFTFTVTQTVKHPDMNIQGLQLIADRYLYTLQNIEHNKLLS